MSARTRSGPEVGLEAGWAGPGIKRWLPLALVLPIFAGDLWLNALVAGDVALSSLYIVPLLMSLWVRRGDSPVPLFPLTVVLDLAVLPFAGSHLDGQSWKLAQLSELDLELVADRAIVIFVLWVTRELALRRLEIESRLAEEREFTRTTLDSIGDAVVATDLTGRVTFMNPLAEHLSGHKRSEALGQPLEQVLQLDGAETPSELPPSPEWRQTTQWLRRGELEIPAVPVDQSRAPILDVSGRARGEVLVLRDATERVRYSETIKRLAYRDELTGLPNRNSLMDRLALELAHARREQARLAVLFLDLDGFKQINDRHGHHAGDAMLKAAADALRGALREGDTIARLGGDEFTVLLPRLGEREDALRVARKILQSVREPVLFEGHQLRCSASIGIALYPSDAETPEVLLRLADEAMYRAKRSGDTVCLHDEGAGRARASEPHGESEDEPLTSERARTQRS